MNCQLIIVTEDAIYQYPKDVITAIERMGHNNWSIRVSCMPYDNGAPTNPRTFNLGSSKRVDRALKDFNYALVNSYGNAKVDLTRAFLDAPEPVDVKGCQPLQAGVLGGVRIGNTDDARPADSLTGKADCEP